MILEEKLIINNDGFYFRHSHIPTSTPLFIAPMN